MRPDLSVNIGRLRLKNPVLVASGTFGYGREYAGTVPLSKLGGIMTKGTSLEPWPGNPPPRLAETPAGMLNAIGLQNPGVDHFLNIDLPWLIQHDATVIVNLAGKTVQEYALAAERLDGQPGVAAIELNISCPNVKEGGIAFGTDPRLAAEVVQAVRRATGLPLIVKLSPNVTSVVEIAQAVEAAGADAFSLINTLLGMAIDVRRRRPVLGNVFGGLSGPAVKPVALRMVWQVAGASRLPIIGMGGIVTPEDALEYVMAGATAVALGTAVFRDPSAPLRVIEGLERFCTENSVPRLSDLVGAARTESISG